MAYVIILTHLFEFLAGFFVATVSIWMPLPGGGGAISTLFHA